MTFDIIVRPLLYRWQGQLPPEQPQVEAVLTRKVLSPMGEDEFLRVALGRVGERIVATPLASGAGVLMSLVKADGIVTIPRFSEGHHAGERVSVTLLRSPRTIDHTIVAIGSHDLRGAPTGQPSRQKNEGGNQRNRPHTDVLSSIERPITEPEPPSGTA
jgi:putative molybdopterin biosynthesis protein